MNFFDFMRNTFVTNEPVWNYYGTEIYTDPVASPDGPHSLFKIISCKVKKATLSMSWMHITT